MRYAQIDENGICFAESFLSGIVEADDMILLSENESSPMSKKYVNGAWVEVEKEPLPQPISDTEILMQSMTELELQNLEAQQERQLLAQQISDLELAMLERNEENV